MDHRLAAPGSTGDASSRTMSVAHRTWRFLRGGAFEVVRAEVTQGGVPAAMALLPSRGLCSLNFMIGLPVPSGHRVADDAGDAPGGLADVIVGQAHIALGRADVHMTEGRSRMP